jgi:hypothetical protein
MALFASRLIIASFAVALAAATHGQSLGDRSSSMGGAGLALDRNLDPQLNPAHLSLLGGGYHLPVPLLEYRASGRDIGQVTSYLRRLRHGGMDVARFGAMQHLPRSSWMDDFGGSVGLVYGAMSLTYLARGYEEFLPSAAGLDTYGVAYEAYQFSFGQEVPLRKGGLSVGTSARLIHASYDHQVVRSGGIQQGLDVVPGGDSQSGFSLDLGMIYRPDKRRDLSYGLVIRNLISPRISFNRQMPDGTVVPNGVEPFRTTVSAGFATRLREGTYLAVDGLDLLNAIGRQQLAIGLDQELNRYLGLQLGYNSRTSFTIGLSFFGITARLAGRTPLTVETGLRF